MNKVIEFVGGVFVALLPLLAIGLAGLIEGAIL